MQELAGRLTALDPEASASLKVIASFDALVAGGVGIEALVRAAATMAVALIVSERMRRLSDRMVGMSIARSPSIRTLVVSPPSAGLRPLIRRARACTGTMMRSASTRASPSA